MENRINDFPPDRLRENMYLTDLVHPDSETEFLQNSFGKDLRIMPGAEGRFEHLLRWSDINRILRFNNIPNSVSMFKEGQVVPPGSYTELLRKYPDNPQNWSHTQHRIVPALVRAHILDGASLVINSLEEL